MRGKPFLPLPITITFAFWLAHLVGYADITQQNLSQDDGTPSELVVVEQPARVLARDVSNRVVNCVRLVL